MKINMKSKSVTLATKGCYCPEDVEVAAVLQEKTVTENGEVVADSGYAGLGKVVVAAPEPDAKIIDVDELPTTDIDDSVYYRMDGKLYKHRAETAVGTWVLNETITARSTGNFFVTGTYQDSPFTVFQYYSNGKLGGAYIGYFLICYGSVSNSVSSFYYDESGKSSLSGTVYLWSSGESVNSTVENRTVTITGGADATDPDLITWLEENAVRQGDNSDWDCYLVPSGSVEITENGTVDVADKKEVVVGVPSNVPVVIGDGGTDTDVILTAENVGKVYYFNGDLYMVENDEGDYKFKRFARSDPNINFAEGTWIFDDNAIAEWFYTLCEYPLPQRFQSDGCDWYGFGANTETGYIYYYEDWPSVEGAGTTDVFSMTDGWVNEAYKTVIFGFGEVKDILTSSSTKISDD